MALPKKTGTFLALSRARKTTYEYAEKDVDQKDLEKILEAARWAPSAGNCQPWKFVVIRNKDKIKWLLDNNQHEVYPFIKRRPPVVVAFILDTTCTKDPSQCILKDISEEELYTSMGLCIAYAILQAAELKIQSCIITPRREGNGSKLGLNSKYHLAFLVGFGYEKKGGFAKDRDRHSLGNLLFEERM